MNRTYYKLGIALMWMALPLTALRYWQVWNELPVRMALTSTGKREWMDDS